MTTYTETTRQSWFSRIGGSFKGILTGLLLFIIGFPLLFWNEGRAVSRTRALKEGEGAVISVTASPVDPANEGRLIHFSGPVETTATLTDSVFGISLPALRLRRTVEMYQWQETSRSETKKNLGGSTETVTTYDYQKVWADERIDSSKFKVPANHANPPMPYESTDFTAAPVTLGAFTLPESTAGGIGTLAPIALPSLDTPLPDGLPENMYRTADGFYLSRDDHSDGAAIGDLRISFGAVPSGSEASIVARQTGATVTPYTTKNGGSVFLVSNGIRDAAAMFQSAHSANKLITWLIRLGGFLLMLMGLNMIFSPLSVLADVLPFLGSIVRAGTGVIAFLTALACALLTIGVAWLTYRPWIGIPCLVAAIGLLFFARKKCVAKPTP